MDKIVVGGLVGVVLSCVALSGCATKVEYQNPLNWRITPVISSKSSPSINKYQVLQDNVPQVFAEEKQKNERNERYQRIVSGNLTNQENFILYQIRNSGRVVGVEITDFESASTYVRNLYGIDLFDSNHRTYYDVGRDIIFRDEFIGDEQYVFHLALAACDILHNGQDFDRKGVMNSQQELNRIESELNKFDLSFYGVFPDARDIYNTNSPSLLGRPIVR